MDAFFYTHMDFYDLKMSHSQHLIFLLLGFKEKSNVNFGVYIVSMEENLKILILKFLVM